MCMCSRKENHADNQVKILSTGGAENTQQTTAGGWTHRFGVNWSCALSAHVNSSVPRSDFKVWQFDNMMYGHGIYTALCVGVVEAGVLGSPNTLTGLTMLQGLPGLSLWNECAAILANPMLIFYEKRNDVDYIGTSVSFYLGKGMCALWNVKRRKLLLGVREFSQAPNVVKMIAFDLFPRQKKVWRFTLNLPAATGTAVTSYYILQIRQLCSPIGYLFGRNNNGLRHCRFWHLTPAHDCHSFRYKGWQRPWHSQ